MTTSFASIAERSLNSRTKPSKLFRGRSPNVTALRFSITAWSSMADVMDAARRKGPAGEKVKGWRLVAEPN
jgi:hypothetical protein